VNGRAHDLELHIGHKAFGNENPEGRTAGAAVIVVFFSMKNFSSSVTQD